MKRHELTAALCAAARQEGYAFFTGHESEIARTVRTFPAAWLTPPQLTALDGRQEGQAVYRVRLHLFRLRGGASPAERDKLWEALETDALAIVRTLDGSAAVRAVGVVDTTPAEGVYTSAGELSLTLRIDVRLHFCNLP